VITVIEDRGSRWTPGRALALGIVGGVVAAIVMAIYAMVGAATYQHHGFFTPLYHIATLLLNPKYLMSSVDQAAAGDAFTFFAGPAAVGVLIHVVVGATYGVVFALIVGSLRLGSRRVVVPVGTLYGLAVVAFSSFVGLPVAANLFDAGTPIRDMPTLAGWVTFTIEHLIFGFVLGLITAAFLRPGMVRRDVSVQSAEAA
jgi:hypothetical protein